MSSGNFFFVPCLNRPLRHYVDLSLAFRSASERDRRGKGRFSNAARPDTFGVIAISRAAIRTTPCASRVLYGTPVTDTMSLGAKRTGRVTYVGGVTRNPHLATAHAGILCCWGAKLPLPLHDEECVLLLPLLPLPSCAGRT